LGTLLEREGINADRPDKDGRGPIAYAAVFGGEAVVKLLLQREEVNPHRPDIYGRTPIMWTAKQGKRRMVALLRF